MNSKPSQQHDAARRGDAPIARGRPAYQHHDAAHRGDAPIPRGGPSPQHHAAARRGDAPIARGGSSSQHHDAARRGDAPIARGTELPSPHAFAAEVRGAARALLPERAMLRRDRGDALFITDAPRREPGTDWPERFAAAGFLCAVENGMAYLTPDGRWLAALSARYPEPPNHLCATLRRFDGPPPEDAVLALFAEALKLLDGAPWDPGFDRRLRQRAAVCLREHCPGGGLYACAVAGHLINTRRNIQ